MSFIKSAVAVLSMLAISSAIAGEVKVEYKDYKKFTDMKPANEARGAFEKRTMASFDKIFADLAKELPEGYSWHVVVTDIDLAGDVNHMFTQTGQQIRVIKDIFIPRINFSYTLLDQNKVTVAEEKDLKLKDMGFMSRGSVNRFDGPFEYEKLMLQRWFNDNIKIAVASETKKTAKSN
ncbi:DUF3016 domain-containing protein [Rheinheimera sediminis]|uniref:DUF3016 domain-containing protein n=1 Tax=Rheinheimera sp. YQF-1 TaxID=2499626 RepID=UPI000FD97B2B|nr:DUF3016 domain-containing protein [Rheinheimera sp. YQF-1]RVT47872.1 DUF3016 domain-containing protein [Rheinheimera sp. YQF-1]